MISAIRKHIGCRLLHLSVSDRLRISAIRFLNPAPLMWDFEHPPQMEQLAQRYQIHTSMPSQCAAEPTNGSADIGLISIAAYATIPASRSFPAALLRRSIGSAPSCWW